MRVILVVLIALLLGCSAENHSDGRDAMGAVPQRNYKKVCLEGHVYFVVWDGSASGITPKLNNLGEPIKCYLIGERHD